MKISTVIISAAVLSLFAGCNSLTNPLAGLFHGHDSRVYNPQTGQWEYPNKNATPAPQKSAAVASALSATPAPQSGGHSTDWVEQHGTSTPAPSPSKPGPASNAVATTGTAEPAAPAAVAPAPPQPRPGRATGFYNATTGKIEWQNAGQTVASATPPPTHVKHWWWPF